MAGESIDRVVLELEARDGQFRSNIEGAATVTDKALARIETSATRMERQVGRSFGQAAQQSRLLGFQISDIGVQLSAGTSPFLVLAQQGPQVANALEGARGAVGRFATFLSGPYGAAVLAATTILGVWLTKNKEASDTVDDLVEKLKAQARQAEMSDRANALFDKSLEGVEKAAREAEKALEVLENRGKTQEQQTVESIQASLANAAAIREETAAMLDAAEAYNERYNGSLASADPRFASEFKVSQSRIDALRATLKKAQDDAAGLESKLRSALSLRAVEEASRSAEDNINAKYDGFVEAARRAALASGAVESALKKEVTAINAARDAELRRIRETQREARKSTSSLPAVTGQEVARILGAPITSGTRTPAQNANARGAKNSYHLSGQAIDIPLTVNGKPLTKAGIRAALEPMGIVIKELLGPGDKGHSDHFHIAFDKRRRGGDEVARSAQQAADAEVRRRQSFENELAQLLGDEIAAKRALVESAEEIATLRLAEIEAERQAYNDNLDALVDQRKMRTEEAALLRAKNDQIAIYQSELVKRNEDVRKFRMAEAERERDARLAGESRADEAAVLQGRADLARTLDERNEIERRLVELQYEEERARNDYIIGFNERLKTQKGIAQSELDEAEAAAAAARLRNASLGERLGNAQARIDRNDPLSRYIDDVSDTKTRVETAMVRQLEEVSDGISDALTKELGIKSQFVRDLFSIFLDEAVFRPLAESLRNRGSGGGGLFGSILSGIGAIFGGGKTVSGGASFGVGRPGRAGGGPTSAGTVYRVNENATPGNPEFFQSDVSGKIIPLGAINDRLSAPTVASQGPIELRVYADEGTFISRVEAISEGKAVEVTMAASGPLTERAVQATMGRLNRPRMPGAGR